MGRVYLIAIAVIIVAGVLVWLLAKRKPRGKPGTLIKPDQPNKPFTGNVDDSGLFRSEKPAGQFASDNMDTEARALLTAGRKIEAIKLVREKTAMSLKDAKDYVERL